MTKKKFESKGAVQLTESRNTLTETGRSEIFLIEYKSMTATGPRIPYKKDTKHRELQLIRETWN